MNRSYETRRKKEVNNLVDLSMNLREKYGPYMGWKLSLRQENPIRFHMGICHEKNIQVLSALNLDDRNRPVEIVRQPSELILDDYCTAKDEKIVKRGISSQ